MNVTSPGVCPEVTFVCTAEDLPSTNLRWFLNDDLFAIYTTGQSDSIINPENITYSTLVGGVNIQILRANPNENDPDIVSFRSSIMFNNISKLQVAGISEISCGLRSEEGRGYFSVDFNSSQGKYYNNYCRSIGHEKQVLLNFLETHREQPF